MPPKKTDTPLPKADPIAFSHQMSEILDRFKPIVKEYTEKQSLAPGSADPLNIQPTMMHFLGNALKKPQKLIDLQVEYAQKMFLLWQEMNKKFLGETSEDIIKPESNDRRFRDPLWNENVLFDFIKQSYLLTSQWFQKTIRDTDGLSPREKTKLDFFTRQFMDSLAPTNFALTNPEVLRETINSKGQNLLKGLENLVEDLERGRGNLQISKTDYNAYEVGRNLALTAGKVVFQNALMQLIQYNATTEQVYETPLLIVPPWINKYYILDMRQDNSFVKWAADQGHTVFMISWVNPDETLAQKTFMSYIEEGLFAALDAIEKITGQKKSSVVGYCIGGTLLTTALAYMTARGMDRIASATFLTTLIDFDNSGDLQVFIDDEQLEALDRKMADKGYLQGSELRNTFSLLRSNDLIWSYVVNNYMLGREPFPFDLLYWNDDSTNMPAAMHSFYLRKMYQENLLCKPGGIVINDTPIDVTKIRTPSYFLSTKDDHIAPWKATYEGMHLLSGEKTFVLSGSGHVAGVVNPPAVGKYNYWINQTIDERDHAEDWLRKAHKESGSWWPHWERWLQGFAGAKTAPRQPQNAIEDAPGSYVKMKAV